MSVDKNKAEGSLIKKGFVRDVSKNHVFYHCYYEGKKVGGVSTCVSHGGKQSSIGNDLLAAMRKQLHLDTLEQVRDLLNCPMKKEQYHETLRKKGLLKN